MNKYLAGARVLGARRAAPREVVGYNWWQVLYNPAGLAYDYSNNPTMAAPSYGAAQNAYFAKQRVAVNPLTAGVTARQQAAAALQAQLRAQQMANIAAMQAQLAATAPPLMSAPSPSMPSDTSAPSADDLSVPDMSAPDSSVVGAAGDQYVVVRIKNLPDVVKKQGGALGNAAFSLLPGVVSSAAYSKIQNELKTKFAEQGVDADVTLVSAPPTGGKATSVGTELFKTAAVGAGAIGLGWAAWHYGLSRLFSRSK